MANFMTFRPRRFRNCPERLSLATQSHDFADCLLLFLMGDEVAALAGPEAERGPYAE
jgi:hypothetical protein